MRTPEVIALELVGVRDELSEEALDVRQAARLRGSLAALEWAVGRTSQAPASRRMIEAPDAGAVSMEAVWAYEVIVGVRPATPTVTRDFAGGVEEALLWLGGSGAPPVPTAELDAATDTPPTVQPRERLAGLYEAMQMERANPPAFYGPDDLRVLDGSLETLSWLLDETKRCPAVGTKGPTEPKTVLAAADKLLKRREADYEDPRRAYEYGIGITLEWACGRTSPVPRLF